MFIRTVRGVRQPRPSFLYRLPHLRPAVYGSLFIMSLSNRAIVQRTWGLRAQFSDLARGDDNSHDGSGVYGPAFEYDEFLQMPSILSALRLTLALFFGAIGIAFFPLVRTLRLPLLYCDFISFLTPPSSAGLFASGVRSQARAQTTGASETSDTLLKLLASHTRPTNFSLLQCA